MKTPHQKVRRRHATIIQLKDLMADFKKRTMLETEPASVIGQRFDSNIPEIVKNELALTVPSLPKEKNTRHQ